MYQFLPFSTFCLICNSLKLFADFGSFSGLAVFLKGVRSPEEPQRFDFPVVNEHSGGLEVVGRRRLVVHAVHVNVSEGHVEAGLDGPVGFEGQALLCGVMGFLPFLQANQDVALVEVGVGFPEVFLLPGEENGQGVGGFLKFPCFPFL